ncbi:hypothetical protein [Nonomuraea sp. NPDC049695]|uniref:hypothetical protein n=1 Tax=Nonomuraea sp. NPDC049695 TaxID=3154734 RepID=UPI003437B9B6
MGQTGQVFGEHGIGKTSTFLSYIPRAHPGTEVVLVPAANLTPDDLLVNAPVRTERGEARAAAAHHAATQPRAAVRAADRPLAAGA